MAEDSRVDDERSLLEAAAAFEFPEADLEGNRPSGRVAGGRCARSSTAATVTAAVALAIALGLVGQAFRGPYLTEALDEATELLEHAVCAAPGENCQPSKCCNTQGYRCYEKKGGYASCKQACEPGKIDPNDPAPFRTPWGCQVLGGPGPGAKPLAPPGQAMSNAGCYVINDGKLLVVKHSYGTFDIPGGLANPGEAPEVTACRETFEETGYKVKTVGLKQVMANGFHIFNCALLEPGPAGTPDPAEVSAVMWPPLTALPQTNWRFQEELAFFK